MTSLDRLGRYTLVERIGEGGMAEVFRARLDGPMGFQKELAIKRIHDSIVREDGDEHVRSLINEARIGGLLKHPNVVETYELGHDEDSYYIAMEFIDGVSLSEILMESRDTGWMVPKEVILDLAIQVCRGLSYAHAFVGDGDSSEQPGVVHRDLKPSNIMITRGGTAKIMDFGISKSTANLFDTTATGVAKGTPLYMSPEQLRGMRPLPTCSDLFSLGVILYELVTGKLLFAGRTIPEIITRVLNLPLDDEIRAVEERIPGLGPVIGRLLDRDVPSRVREARDVAIELQHVLDWQEKRTSTAEFVQDFIRGRWSASGSLSTAALRAQKAAELPVPEGVRVLNPPGSETIVSRYLAAQRRRRAGVWLLAVLLGLAIAGAGWLVWRGTVGVSRGVDHAESLLNEGDLEGALGTFREHAGDQRSRHEALVGAAAVAALQGGDKASREALATTLAVLPEETGAEYVYKYRVVAWVQRAGGDYRLAMQVTKDALDRARQDARVHGAPMPAALMWDAGELTLLRDAPDAARGYFRELQVILPPGRMADAASAYEQQIATGNAPSLRAELLYVEGDPAAWDGLSRALDRRVGPADRARDERLLWAWRALGEERWERAGELAEKAARGADKDRRAQALAVKAAARAAAGQTDAARRALDQALRTAPHDDFRHAARLQTARALLETAGDALWFEELMEQLEQDLGAHDPDVVLLRAAQIAPPPERFSGAGQLAWDPRTGRLLRSDLVRGGPSGSQLVAASDWGEHNRSDDGLAWPFGPSWHPIDGSPMAVIVHPGR